MRFLAPDLLNLFCTLGEMKRNANEEQGLMTEDIKALCSLCLNARSMRVKGLQLMIDQHDADCPGNQQTGSLCSKESLNNFMPHL